MEKSLRFFEEVSRSVFSHSFRMGVGNIFPLPMLDSNESPEFLLPEHILRDNEEWSLISNYNLSGVWIIYNSDFSYYAIFYNNARRWEFVLNSVSR